jgi:hypothetical protein
MFRFRKTRHSRIVVVNGHLLESGFVRIQIAQNEDVSLQPDLFLN